MQARAQGTSTASHLLCQACAQRLQASPSAVVTNHAGNLLLELNKHAYKSAQDRQQLLQCAQLLPNGMKKSAVVKQLSAVAS